jgi:uncharacterized protein (UPF0261 family)
MATVVLLGTLDTKGIEYDYLRMQVQATGCDVLLIDAGIISPPLTTPDISRQEVAAAAGADVTKLAAAGDRGAAIQTMADGATVIVKQLFEAGQLHGILSVGGTGNSSLAAQAMQALPVGVPKLMVSTVASGDTRPYMGVADIAMMHSVVDIAGINQISERILANAANGIAGMAQGYAAFKPSTQSKPLITATMFGVTTPCVTVARTQLESLGYEVLVFHATGAGGRSMEALIDAGFIVGSLDITTTEWADELVGGVLNAGPHRLEAAGRKPIPQVVSLGALDMVNFGPMDTVPEKFRTRNIYKHNPTVTLMRTTPEECAQLGRIIAEKLSMAKGPTALFIPLRGISMIAVEGKPFYDPEADQALIESVKANLAGNVELYELDMDINDPHFAQAMADKLHAFITAQGA